MKVYLKKMNVSYLSCDMSKINCLHLVDLSQKSDIKQGNICSVKFAIFNDASDIQYKFLRQTLKVALQGMIAL